VRLSGAAGPVGQRSAAGPVGRRVALGVGSGAVLLAALDAYVVVTVLIQIVQDIGVPPQHLERATPLITGYLLGYVAAMPLFGSLADRYGRRLVTACCLAGFAVGSALTAAATTLPALVGGRVLQGAAGGALLPVTMALVADLWPPRRRPMALGAIGAVQELGSVIGPLYGAALAAAIGWRGLFWVNVPLAVVAVAAVSWAVPPGPPRAEQVQPDDEPGPPGRPAAKPHPRVDYLGGVLLAVALGLVVVGLHNPDPDRALLAPWGPAVASTGGVLLVLFVIVQMRTRHPLLNLRGAAKRPFLAALGASFLAGAALMVTLLEVQLIAQTLLDKDSLGGAVLLLRFLVALPIGAALGGLAVARLGERWVSAVGLAVAAAGYLLLGGWLRNPGAAPYHLGPLDLPRMDTDLAIAGAGLGLVIAPLAAAVLRAMPADRYGVASASVVVSRTLGMLLGVAALSAWGLHQFHELTRTLNTPFPFGLTDDEFQRQWNAYTTAVRAALCTEYRQIFLVVAALCALGVLVSFALQGRPAHRPDDPARTGDW